MDAGIDFKDTLFILYPREVQSSTDGELHFVSEFDLIRLYRPPSSAYTTVYSRKDYFPMRYWANKRDMQIKCLYPDPTGEYSLAPKKITRSTT